MNLVDLKGYMDKRGLYVDVLNHIMENDLKKFSPFYALCEFKPYHVNGLSKKQKYFNNGFEEGGNKYKEEKFINNEKYDHYDSQMIIRENNDLNLNTTKITTNGGSDSEELIPLNLCPIFFYFMDKMINRCQLMEQLLLPNI